MSGRTVSRYRVHGLLLAFAGLTGIAQAAEDYPRARDVVVRTLAEHPELIAVTIHLSRPVEHDNIIVASNIAAIGKKADADDQAILNTNRTVAEFNRGHTRFGVALRMLDQSKRVIGVLALGFQPKPGVTRDDYVAAAERIRDEVARNVPDAGALAIRAP